jgi:endonuclease/exonuclease/phosphatase family metal-dependent hydrolase
MASKGQPTHWSVVLSLLLLLLLHCLAAGEEPRTKSAALLVAKLQDISAGSPVVLVGDLNAGAASGKGAAGIT